MAWKACEKTNIDFIKSLKSYGLIKSDRVEKVMQKVDRADFCPSSPYADAPKSIGYGATISAPHMHAHSLELLLHHLIPGNKALDVGSGSGFLTTCMGEMVSPNGRAIGVEHIPELVKDSLVNIRKHHADLLDKQIIKIIEGDGRGGYPDEQYYNAIHVGAACPTKPQALIDQLAPGGRLIAPVKSIGGYQEFMQYDKDSNGNVKETPLLDVAYVPLTDKEKQYGQSTKMFMFKGF